MSQRRQDARKAEQEKRREAEREKRRQQKVSERRTVAPSGTTKTTTTTTTTPSGSGTGTRPRPAAPATTARLDRMVAPSRMQRRDRRPLIIGSTIGGIVLLALVGWLIYQQTRPLPGVHFNSNGNQHVIQGDAHGAYFSNPPTSGWHLDPIPNPGIYDQARTPESVGHFMEHGGVWVLYTCPDGCADEVQQLTDLVNKQTGRNHPVALAPYPAAGYTAPEHRFNLVAWQRMLSLDNVDTGKMNDFIERLQCQYNPEGPGWCGAVKGKIGEVKTPESGGFNAVATPSGAAAPSGSPATTATPGVTVTPAATTTPATTATPAR